MASRTTRNKIRWQAKGAIDNLQLAQKHLCQLAYLAGDRSDYIDNNAAELIACTEMLLQAVEKFSEGL